MSSLSLIINREYTERVKRKSFIITTLLTPIFMLGIMLAPALIMLFAGPEDKTIAVIDESSAIAGMLPETDEVKFVAQIPGVSLDSLKKSDRYDAVLVIGADVVDNPANVALYTMGAPSIQTEQFISGVLENAIETHRIMRYDIDNLQQIIADINVHVSMDTYRLDTDSEEATSSGLSYFAGLILSMMLYMFIMIYGQMVMNSIIEEKNNRVLEIVVSSVKPASLMLGKIFGICLVAVTQILIWGVLMVAASKWLLPALTSGMDVSSGSEMFSALTQLGDTGYIISLVTYALLFLVGGFLFYAAIYAAIGSAVDNIQDASQLTIVAVLPIILGIVFSMTAINDPQSSLAFWLSVVPFTSPMVMMARLPFGIPGWEIAVSLCVLALSFLAMIWLSAKIYRVGIFMYGKKPTFAEILRWARYK